VCLSNTLSFVLLFVVIVDIIRCLSGLTDSLDREVNFEIVWIDDTTFLVAASFRGRITAGGNDGAAAADDEMESVLRDHGSIIKRALRARFPHESIVVLESHLRALEAARKNARQRVKENWLDWALSFVGLKTKRDRDNTGDGDEGPANKRRRVD